MAQLILTNAKVFTDQYDVSGYLNQLSTQKAADTHDVTPFGATSRRFAPGLQSGNFQFQGFTEFGTSPIKIEKIMANLKGTVDKALTVVPEGPTIGNVAILIPAAFHGYEIGGPHGNPNTFTWNGGTSKWQPVSGFLEETGATARTATGNSPGAQLGTVGATQFLYAAIHVTAASGSTPTLDVIVESDNSGSFSSPTTVITFSQLVTTGAAITRVAGAIADDFFRFKWTIGGGSPSFNLTASFGIAS